MSELDRALNDLVFAVTGERWPVVDPDGALASRGVLLDLGRGLRGLSGEVQSAVVRVGAGMPRGAGDAYVRALRGLVDEGGANPLRELADEVEKVAERRVLISMQVREARIGILLEVSLLLAQIQMYLALSYFTGGVSLGAVAALRARAALRVLLALQALSHSVVPLVGAPLEALQETLQSVAARLLTMASAPSVGRPSGVDWGKVGQDALFGAFAGLFGEVLGGATSPVVEKLSKSVLGGKPALVVPVRVVNSGVVEGGAESLGEMFTVGVLQGRWAFSVQTGLGAALSGVVSAVLLMGAEVVGKALHKVFFAPWAASASSSVPGSAGVGSGGGGVNAPGVLDGWAGIGAGLAPAVPAADLPLARPYDAPPVVTATTPPPAVTPTVSSSPVTAAPLPSPAFTAPPSAPAPGSTPTTADLPSVPHPGRDTGGLPYGQPEVTLPRTPQGREPADNGAAPGGVPAAGGSPAPGSSRTGTADITGVLTGHDARTTAPPTADGPEPAGDVPDTGEDLSGAITPTVPPAMAPSHQVQPSPPAVEPSPARATASAPAAAAAPDTGARNGTPHPETSQDPESSAAAPHDTAADRATTVREGGPGPLSPSAGTAPAPGVPTAVTPVSTAAAVPDTGARDGMPRPETASSAAASHDTAADRATTVREGGPGPLSPSAGTAPGVPTAVAAVPGVPAARVPGPQGEPVFVPLTGEEPSGALLSEALPGGDGSGQGGGRAWFTQEDMERRREHYGHLSAVRHRAVWDPAADQEGPLEALAGPDTVYTAALHIGARGAELPLSDGRTGVTDGRGLGKVLKRRPSLVRLGPHTELRLLACAAGEQPDKDPLEQVPFGQDVATETGLVVHADTGKVALVGPSLGRPARIGVVDSLTAPEHRQTSFHPEPGPAELEAAAWRAGLAPGTDRPAERALRWLRAIRQEAGPDLGWNPDRRHETLLRGAMAWENTRPAAAEPLTGPELTRLLEHHRLTHPGATLTQALTLAGSTAPASAPVTTSAAPLTAPRAEDARGTRSAPFAEPSTDPGAPLTPALTPTGPPAPTPATTSAAAPTPTVPVTAAVPPRAEDVRETVPAPAPTPFADPQQYNSGRAPSPSFTDLLVDELVHVGLAAEPDRGWMTSAAQALTALVWRERSAVDPVDIDATARAALSLEDGTPVEAAQYLELLELLRDAAQEGRDGSTPALAAYYLEERGALDSGGMLYDRGGWITGRSLRDGPSFTLDTSTVTMLVEDEAGGLSERTARRGPAPWTGATVYVMEAEGDAEGRRVRMRLADGTQRWADGPVLAELLRNDPWLTSGMVVVLAVTDAGGRGAVLPHLVADALGRDVWTPTGRVALADSGGPGTPRLLARITDRAGAFPVGRWLVTSPGTDPLPELDPTAYQILKDTSGNERLVPDSALDTYTLVRGGRAIGRTSFTPADQRTFEQTDQHLSDLTEYVVTDPVLGATREIRRMPWADLVAAGTPIWDFDAHGTTDGLIVWRVGGQKMRGEAHEAGAWARRVPSLLELDRRATAGHTSWIRVQSCHFGGLRDGTVDPLETPEPAQDFANAARHPVMAATTIVLTRDDSARYNSGVTAPYDGGPAEWRVFRPEPRDAELDALARSMGVGSAPRALRLVRALRRMFGPEAERDPDLVTGIGALEGLRRADPVLGAFGPLTMDFLDHTARTHAARSSAPPAGADLTTARRDLLRAAGGWMSHALTDPRGRRELTAYLPMPAASRIAAEWNARGGDTLGRRVLDPDGAGGSAPLTGAERARAFWALVRTRETLDGFEAVGAVPGVVRGVLHLDANATVSRADERMAVVRGAQAYTHGYPDAGPAAWAAYDLGQRGVGETAEVILGKEGEAGLSFAGRTAPVAGLDTTVYAVGLPGSLRQDTRVPWDPSKSKVAEVAEVREHTVVVHAHGGSALTTSHRVFAQWLAAGLPRHGGPRFVVLVGPVTATDPSGAAHALVRAVAEATGRAVATAPAGSSLTATPDGHLITVENGTPAGDWLTALPPRSQSPDLALNRLTTDGWSVGPARNARTGSDHGFDVRVLPLDVVPVVDLTVMVEFAPAPVPATEREEVWKALTEGVDVLFNRPGHHIGTYRHRLRVTVEQVLPGQGAHMRVRLRDSGPMDRHRWITGQPPAQYAVQIGRQLGLGNADPTMGADTWTPGPSGLSEDDLTTLQNLTGAGSPPTPGATHSGPAPGNASPFADPALFNSGRAPAAPAGADPVPPELRGLVDDLVLFGAGTESDRNWMTSAVRSLAPLLPYGPFTLRLHGLDDAARTVLSLEEHDPVGAAEHRLLLETVLDAVTVGRGGSLPALAAYHLEREGALDSVRLLTDTSGLAVGRNWTSAPVGVVDTRIVTTVRRDGSGRWRTSSRGPLEPAPWAGGPVFLLVAEADPAGGSLRPRVRVPLDSGPVRQVDSAVLAELLRQDREFQPGTALVLVVPQNGELLPRALARGLGREVWSGTGTLLLGDHDGSGTRTFLARPAKDPVQWLLTPPSLGPAPEEDPSAGQVLLDASDNPQFVPDSALRTYAIATEPGFESSGRASLDPGSWARSLSQLTTLSAQGEYRALGGINDFTVGVRPAPWAQQVAAGVPIYDVVAHGNIQGLVSWRHQDGRTLYGSAREAGLWLRRRPSFERLKQRAAGGEVWFRTLVCHFGGRPVTVHDPLEKTDAAQEFANTLRHPGFAPTGVAVTFGSHQVSSVGVRERFEGGQGQWRVVRPEPEGADLENLARAFGVEAVAATPPGSVPSALRLVRALRLTAGSQAERDPDLVAGIGALEALRRADPVLAAFGPFTMDFLDHAAGAYAARTGAPAGTAPRTLRRELLAAAGQWAAQARTMSGVRPGLAAFLPMPGVSRAAAIWNAEGGDVLVPGIVGLRGQGRAPGPETPERRAAAFWALVRADQDVADAVRTAGPDAVASAVLHLPPGTAVDAVVHRTLLLRAAQAYAAQFPDAGPAVWAAQDLRYRGLFGAAPAVTADGRHVGRSLAGTTVLDLNITAYVVSAPGVPPRFEIAPWEAGESFILVLAGIGAGGVVLRRPGGPPLETAHEAFAHLVSLELMRVQPQPRHLVLVGPVSDVRDAARLAQVTADVSGRAVRIAAHGSWAAPTADGRHVITVPQATGTSPGRPADWLTFTPAHRPLPGADVERQYWAPHAVGPARNARTGREYGFDWRRMPVGVDGVVELTVLVQFTARPAAMSTAELDGLWQRLEEGVDELFNRPGHRIDGQKDFRVRVERAGSGQSAHMKVEVTGPNRRRTDNRHRWRADATSRDLATRIGRQLGLSGDDTWTPGPDGLTQADLTRVRDLLDGTGKPSIRTYGGPSATPAQDSSLPPAAYGGGGRERSPFADPALFNSGRAGASRRTRPSRTPGREGGPAVPPDAPSPVAALVDTDGMVTEPVWQAVSEVLREWYGRSSGRGADVPQPAGVARRNVSAMLWYLSTPGASWSAMPARFGRNAGVIDETLRYWNEHGVWRDVLESALRAAGRDPALAEAAGLLSPLPDEARPLDEGDDRRLLLDEDGTLKDAAWRAMRPMVLARALPARTRRRWNTVLYWRLGFTAAQAAERFDMPSSSNLRLGLTNDDVAEIEAWVAERGSPLAEDGDWRELTNEEAVDLAERVPALVPEDTARKYGEARGVIAGLTARRRRPKTWELLGNPLWDRMQRAGAEAVRRAERRGRAAPDPGAGAERAPVLGVGAWLRLRETLRDQGHGHVADREMFRVLDGLVRQGRTPGAALPADEHPAAQVRAWRESGLWPTLRGAAGIGPGLAWLDDLRQGGGEADVSPRQQPAAAVTAGPGEPDGPADRDGAAFERLLADWFENDPLPTFLNTVDADGDREMPDPDPVPGPDPATAWPVWDLDFGVDPGFADFWDSYGPDVEGTPAGGGVPDGHGAGGAGDGVWTAGGMPEPETVHPADLTGAIREEDELWGTGDEVFDFDFDFTTAPDAPRGDPADDVAGDRSVPVGTVPAAGPDQAAGSVPDGAEGNAGDTSADAGGSRAQARRLHYVGLVDDDRQVTEEAWRELRPVFLAYRVRNLRPVLNTVLYAWHGHTKEAAARKFRVHRSSARELTRHLAPGPGQELRAELAIRPAGSVWSDLDDNEWRRLAPLLVTEQDEAGITAGLAEDRAALGALAWLTLENARWDRIPADRFPPWRTVHSKLKGWLASGFWDELTGVVPGSVPGGDTAGAAGAAVHRRRAPVLERGRLVGLLDSSGNLRSEAWERLRPVIAADLLKGNTRGAAEAYLYGRWYASRHPDSKALQKELKQRFRIGRAHLLRVHRALEAAADDPAVRNIVLRATGRSGTAAGTPWSALSDEDWTAMAPYMLGREGRRLLEEARSALGGLAYMNTRGGWLRGLPTVYGSPMRCRTLLRRWRAQGVWDRVLETAVALPALPALPEAPSSGLRPPQHTRDTPAAAPEAGSGTPGASGPLDDDGMLRPEIARALRPHVATRYVPESGRNVVNAYLYHRWNTVRAGEDGVFPRERAGLEYSVRIGTIKAMEERFTETEELRRFGERRERETTWREVSDDEWPLVASLVATTRQRDDIDRTLRGVAGLLRTGEGQAGDLPVEQLGRYGGRRYLQRLGQELRESGQWERLTGVIRDALSAPRHGGEPPGDALTAPAAPPEQPTGDTGAEQPDTDAEQMGAGAGLMDLDAGQPDADAGQTGPGAGQMDLDAGRTDLDAGRTDLDAGRTVPDAGRTDPGAGRTDPDAGRTDPDAGRTDPGAGRTVPDAGRTDLDAGRTDPGAGRTDLDAGRTDPGTGQMDPGAGQTDPDAGQTDPGAGSPPAGDSRHDGGPQVLLWEDETVEVLGEYPAFDAALAHGLGAAVLRTMTDRADAGLADRLSRATGDQAAETLYAWAATTAGEADIPASGVLLSPGTLVPLDVLSVLEGGVPQALQTQAALMGQDTALPAGELTRLRQFQVACLWTGERSLLVEETVAVLAARALGVEVGVLAGPGRDRIVPLSDVASDLMLLLLPLPEGGFRIALRQVSGGGATDT